MLLTAGRTTGTTRKKAFGKIRRVGGKGRDSSVRREVNALLIFAAVRFVILSSPSQPPHKKYQHVQSSAEREQGDPDQEGVDQRHNAATS